MRKSRRSTFRPEKPFINNYHINEVPLPYYNPLQDPYLRGYFSNRKVTTHLNEMGLIYSPRKQYPYRQRRSKNAHKFLKPNLCKIPASNLSRTNLFQNKSCMSNMQREELFPHERDDKVFGSMPRRKAGSEIIHRTPNKIININELIASQKGQKRGYSPDYRAKSQLLNRRHLSAKKRQNAEEELGV